MAGQGPKARALAKEITDGLISLGGPAEGFETCLVSTNGTVLDDGEDVTSPRASTAVTTAFRAVRRSMAAGLSAADLARAAAPVGPSSHLRLRSGGRQNWCS